MRKDESETADPWEVADDHKRLNCVKWRKEKAVIDVVKYGSKYNPKLSKTMMDNIE